MATKNIVPRTGSEGEIGTSSKPWSKAHINDVIASEVSASYLSASSDIRVAGNSHFGSELANSHIFTGSFYQTGSGATSYFIDTIDVAGNLTASGHVSASALFGDGTGITGVTAEWDGTHTGDAQITGSLFIGSGHVNLEGNSYFFQGSSAGGTNVSLIGVNSSDQVFIGNAGYQNVLDSNTYVSGNLEVSNNLTASGHVSASAFFGDGTGITGVTAEWDGTHTGDAEITGTLTIKDATNLEFVSAGGVGHGSITNDGAGITTIDGANFGGGSIDTLQIGANTSNVNINGQGSVTMQVYNGFQYMLMSPLYTELYAAVLSVTGSNPANDEVGLQHRPSTHSTHNRYTAMGYSNTYGGSILTAGAIGSGGDNKLIFQVSNDTFSEFPCAAFDHSGNLGVATLSPSYKLEVVGDISGSTFYGDGSGLTGITAEWDGTHVGNAEITGSLTMAQGGTTFYKGTDGTTSGSIFPNISFNAHGVNSTDGLIMGNQTSDLIMLSVLQKAIISNLTSQITLDGSNIRMHTTDVLVTGSVETSGDIETLGKVVTPRLDVSDLHEPGGNREMALSAGATTVFNDFVAGKNAGPDLLTVDRVGTGGKVGIGYNLGSTEFNNRHGQFTVSGSTSFGELSTDTHQFTGSVDVSSNISASAFYGDINVQQATVSAAHYPIFVDGTTGERTPQTDVSLAYNPSNNTLYPGNLQVTQQTKMVDTTTPSTPSGGALMYAKSGQIYTQNDDGIESLVGQEMIAMSKIETVADTVEDYDIHVFSSSPTNTFQAVNWTIDGSTRYVKSTFTAPANGQAKVTVSTFLKDAGGTSEVWFGLHNASTDTTTPTYGWFQVAKDSEAGEHDLESVSWILTGLTPGASTTVYLHAICTLAGSQVKVGRQSPSAWSNNDLPRPTTISVHTVPVTIDVNPT